MHRLSKLVVDCQIGPGLNRTASGLGDTGEARRIDIGMFSRRYLKILSL